MSTDTEIRDQERLSDSDDYLVVKCPYSGQPLLHIFPTSREKPLMASGICESCEQLVAYSELEVPSGKSPPRWALKYLGYWCKTCWDEYD